MEEPQARVSPESYKYWSRTEYYSKSMPHANPQPMPPILSIHHGVRSPCNKTMERKLNRHIKFPMPNLPTCCYSTWKYSRYSKSIQRRLKKKNPRLRVLSHPININPASRTDPNQRDWHGGGVCCDKTECSDAIKSELLSTKTRLSFCKTEYGVAYYWCVRISFIEGGIKNNESSVNS